MGPLAFRGGAIALLFGAGMPGQSSHLNDVYTDGQLFMKSRAGAFLESGGLTIPAELGPQRYARVRSPGVGSRGGA